MLRVRRFRHLIVLWTTFYLFVCEFVHGCFDMFFNYCFVTFTSTLTILHTLTYFDITHLFQKKSDGQGQWSSSHWPSLPNHENQFFSESKNIVSLKFWEMVVLIGTHNRLDFGRNRSRHSGSRSYHVIPRWQDYSTLMCCESDC